MITLQKQKKQSNARYSMANKLSKMIKQHKIERYRMGNPVLTNAQVPQIQNPGHYSGEKKKEIYPFLQDLNL